MLHQDDCGYALHKVFNILATQLPNEARWSAYTYMLPLARVCYCILLRDAALRAHLERNF